MQRLDKFNMPKDFRGRSLLVVQIWWLVQGSLFRMSPQGLYGWRRFLLRAFGAKIGVGVIVRPSVKVTYPWKLEVGNYSWIGNDVELYTLGPILIGENVVVSQNSYLCTGSHDYCSEYFDIYSKKIVIEDEAWLASDVFIHPGVTIGSGAVVSARSTVSHDVPPGMIAAGFPAKPIRHRNSSGVA